MDILKFSEFITENYQDSPEEYIKSALIKIQKRIEGLFAEQEEGTDEEGEEGEEDSAEVMTLGQAMKKGEEKEKKNSKMSLTDMGLRLESSESSNYSAILDNVSFKFSDEDGWYSLFVGISLEEAKPEDNEDDFSDSDIKECSVKFKRYNLDDDLVGQLGPRTVKCDDVNEEMIVDLKIELDEDSGGEEEGLGIETE